MPEAKRKAKPNWHGTLHELLSTILAFDEKAREQALDRECADDPRLKAEILSLCQTLPAIDANPVLEANQTIANRFVVLDRLGRGGMGEVYRARDLHLDRVVAIKVLRARAVGDPESRRRMENEARALSSLAHPRICALYDLYFEVSSPVLVMEYLEGDTLDSRLESGPMPLAAIFETAFQILDALSYAHERGVVHCDLKPSNVMLTPSGAKVLDFGVAKRFLTPTPQVAIQNLALTDAQTNLLFGTPSYMSPEQALGKALDARSDLFSFGALLYEVTTRKRAFSGDTAISTLAAVLTTEPKPARQLNSAAPANWRVYSSLSRKGPGRPFCKCATGARCARGNSRFHHSAPVATDTFRLSHHSVCASLRFFLVAKQSGPARYTEADSDTVNGR